LSAHLALVGVDRVDLPSFSQFELHQRKHDSMRKSVVSTQICN
jgi:hypothetical protein